MQTNNARKDVRPVGRGERLQTKDSVRGRQDQCSARDSAPQPSSRFDFSDPNGAVGGIEHDALFVAMRHGPDALVEAGVGPQAFDHPTLRRVIAHVVNGERDEAYNLLVCDQGIADDINYHRDQGRFVTLDDRATALKRLADLRRRHEECDATGLLVVALQWAKTHVEIGGNIQRVWMEVAAAFANAGVRTGGIE